MQYETVTMFKSKLSGKVYSDLDSLNTGDRNHIKTEIEQEFFLEYNSDNMSINIDKLIYFKNIYGSDIVMELITELL